MPCRAPSRWLMQGPITLLLALAPAAAMAQAPVASGAEPLGRIAGIAWDSLRMRPIAGAAVWSQTAARTTIADSVGRFVLDSLPSGTHHVVASDPALDSLGVQLTQLVQVDPSRAPGPPVTLTTPSLTTLQLRMCGADVDLSERHGIIFGVVREATTGNRLAGAVVDASWLRVEITPDGERAIPGIVAARPFTDSIGAYAACGVPIDTTVQLTAFAGARGTSGTLQVDVGLHRLVRRDLLVAPAHRDPDAPTGSVRGVVTDSLGQPLKGVEVSVDATSLTTRTSGAGEFILQRVPLGSQTVIVRRPGYAPVYADAAVGPQSTPYLHVVMSTVRLLNAVEIRAERASRVMEQVDRRRRIGIGHHRTAEELQYVHTYTSLFRSVPSIRMEMPRNFGDFVLYGPDRSILGGPCVLTVFIDGMKSNVQVLEAFPVKSLVAVEVYARGTEVPQEYAGRTNGCGAVLVWTRTL